MLKVESSKSWSPSPKISGRPKKKGKGGKNVIQPKEEPVKPDSELTIEELNAKKELEKKMQEESDLQNAADLFGFTYKKDEPEPKQEAPKEKPKEDKEDTSFTTQAEFDELAKILENTILKSKNNRLYSQFVTSLVSTITQPLPEDSLRKLSSSLTTSANDKQRATKLQQKSKSNASQRSCLRVEADVVSKGSAAKAGIFDDYDFM